VVRAFHLLHRIVHLWVEAFAESGDALDADPRADVLELLENHGDALRNRRHFGGVLGCVGRSLQIVEDRQQLRQEFLSGSGRRLFEIAASALAEVVEVRGRPEQLVLHAAKVRLETGGGVDSGTRIFLGRAGVARVSLLLVVAFGRDFLVRVRQSTLLSGILWWNPRLPRIPREALIKPFSPRGRVNRSSRPALGSGPAYGQ